MYAYIISTYGIAIPWDEVQCNAVITPSIFHQNLHNRHPIARPWGLWGVCCEFEVWFKFCFCQLSDMGTIVIDLDRVITALDCISLRFHKNQQTNLEGSLCTAARYNQLGMSYNVLRNWYTYANVGHYWKWVPVISMIYSTTIPRRRWRWANGNTSLRY